MLSGMTKAIRADGFGRLRGGAESDPAAENQILWYIRHPPDDERFDYQFTFGKLYGIDQFLSWSIKQSTGLFGFR